MLPLISCMLESDLSAVQALQSSHSKLTPRYLCLLDGHSTQAVQTSRLHPFII